MQETTDEYSVAMGNRGLVSCLCVTEDRPAFLPWLFWNYQKQDYKARELVVVDSSRDPLTSTDPSVTVVRCPPRMNVACKRNLAVEAARGTLITWFDDDDWQHPRKLSILAAALGKEGLLAGSRQSWFVDVYHGRARPHDAQRNVIFNGLAVRRAALDGVRFDEQRVRGADTAWVVAVRRQTRCSVCIVPEVLSCWLCHGANISNPVTRYVFPHPLANVAHAVGAADWGDTDQEFARLRSRLSQTSAHADRHWPDNAHELQANLPSL
jgi:glycosyltransferase involved in cell wall biosynthesis